MPFALIPFMLLVIPVLEIAVFILVGNLIGLWPTLGLVVVTAIIGSMLLRQQGISTLARIQAETRQGKMPGRELVNGVMIAIAGVLLLTPGLVTDTLGFLLFVPPVRDGIWNFMKSRVVVVAGQQFSSRAGGPGAGPAHGRHPSRHSDDPDVIDLTGDEYKRAPDASSPWHESDRTDSDTSGKPNGRTLH